MPFIKLPCCTCYHSWSCNKPFCENLHLDINTLISWHFWCARCPALRTNVPLWRCGWATCAVLSDFLRVLHYFQTNMVWKCPEILWRSLKFEAIWGHFQISSPTFQRKSCQGTSILVTLPPKTFSILSSSNSSADTCDGKPWKGIPLRIATKNILYWCSFKLILKKGMEHLSSILSILNYMNIISFLIIAYEFVCTLNLKYPETSHTGNCRLGDKTNGFFEEKLQGTPCQEHPVIPSMSASHGAFSRMVDALKVAKVSVSLTTNNSFKQKQYNKIL